MLNIMKYSRLSFSRIWATNQVLRGIRTCELMSPSLCILYVYYIYIYMYVCIYICIYIYTHSVHLQTNKSSYTHAPIGPTTLFGSEVTPYSLAPGPNILRVGHSNLEKTLSKYINHKPTILSGNQTRVGNPLYLQSSNKIDGFPASHV